MIETTVIPEVNESEAIAWYERFDTGDFSETGTETMLNLEDIDQISMTFKLQTDYLMTN